MTYRPDIQILRGFAVALVLLYHLQTPGFSNGFLGVDIFFVLSGYLMAQLYIQSTPKDFYKRRLKRLLPAYMITITLTTLAVAFITVPSDAYQRFSRVWLDLLGLSNIAFWQENSYFDTVAFKPLLNLWSLGVELQYYLIVPFLLPLLRKKTFLLSFCIIGSVLAAFFLTTLSPKTSFFMMPLRLWEFLIGAFVAWTSSSKKTHGLYTSALYVLCLIIILACPVSAQSFSFIWGHPGIGAFLMASLTGVMLYRPLHNSLWDYRYMHALLGKAGDYSYSIYLVHFPLIVLWHYRPFGGTVLGPNTLVDTFCILGLTALISGLMFHRVESMRTQKYFAKHFLKLMFISILVLLASPYINKLRYSPEQHHIFNAWNDRDTYRCGKLFRVLNPTKTLCPISDITSKEKVLLLGNSHADSIKSSFAQSMRKKGIESLFYTDNAPLMSPKHNANYVYEVIKSERITHVVIHYSPPFYQQNTYVSELKALLCYLKKSGITVYAVAPVPTYPYHIPEALYSKSLNENVNLSRITPYEYLEENQSFFTFALENQKANDIDTIYLPHKWLCSSHCHLTIDGKPLYFDSSHLTLTGANLLSPMFDKIAQRISP